MGYCKCLTMGRKSFHTHPWAFHSPDEEVEKERERSRANIHQRAVLEGKGLLL